MGNWPRIVILAVAGIALVAGAAAYVLLGEEHDHEESGLVAGDAVKVVAVGAALGAVAVGSLVYIIRRPPGET